MQTKLTLRLDDELIRNAKSYAADTGKSLSQLVADYFALLKSGRPNKTASHSAPLTRSLRGVLKNSGVSERDYRRHLEEKYR